MVGVLRRIARSEFAGQNLVLAALLIAGLFLAAIVIITPLDLVSQALFGLLTITAMLLIKGHPSRGVTLTLIALSIVVSTWYIWWRLTETLQFGSPFEAFLGIGLIMAELYAWLVLVLGYIQTAWPLNRTPEAMPEDLADWPTVDLFIPTYNEPLSVVQNTVLGALSVDYPPENLKIYVPDECRRGESVPNEGLLFYGLIQDGNDLWNAAFFCGSCAVMRRSAVESVGGFATQTVTEDAHTALRLHRAGWNSAYLKLPLAAGLATERLAIHVGQRMRWARGMTQIFRVDNPLLGRGLSFGQRVCYLNAMLHFFLALPRFIFLTAPLAYLMFRLNIIAASGLMVIAYAVPHLWHSTMTNSRLQSRYRHSFWGDIYESVLAMYLLKPPLTTLLNPNPSNFNATEQGGVLPAD